MTLECRPTCACSGSTVALASGTTSDEEVTAMVEPARGQFTPDPAAADG
ncbi:hypothetical protein [Modestobacter lapidis]|nr:hypothetical protein [Modestobacter lapidis]